MSQGEGEERAGQKKAASGKAGRSLLLMVPLLLLVIVSGFRRLRGLCADKGVGGMVVGVGKRSC